RRSALIVLAFTTDYRLPTTVSRLPSPARDRREPMPINVGPVVRRLRERHRMTQQDLVEYTGLDRSSSYISSIETGRTSPTLHELEQIARVYQVPLLDLLQDGGRGSSEPEGGPSLED